MKRKHTDVLEGKKKVKKAIVKDICSAEEQSKPYLQATVKFPIDQLTPDWKFGSNRPINETHKRQLVQVFKDSGILRRDAGHRLYVTCSKAHVEQMLDHLKQKESEAGNATDARMQTENADKEWPSFEDWGDVIGEKAELLAGNHRIEALKEHLRQSESPEAERWWVCNIYDRDALPLHLHIQLRANREDTLLSDSHGQIWGELVALSSLQNDMFQGSAHEVEEQLSEHLRLNSQAKCPVNRLCMLWKNKHWNAMITEWCSVAIGRATFSVRVFAWMMGCRIDDYWFAAFDEVIEVVAAIQMRFSGEIQLADWNQLARLPTDHTPDEVQRLFYPGCEEKPAAVNNRRHGFLKAFDDEAYHSLCQCLCSDSPYRFFNVQALLQTKEQDGKRMSIVMMHVVQWMNLDPTKVRRSDSNKPLLREDLVSSLRKKYGDQADEQSIVVQQQLLNYVQSHMQDFTTKAVEHFLNKYPETDDATYALRFQHVVWQDLLSLVLDLAGPNLQHPCVARFNKKKPSKVSSRSSPAIAQRVRDLIAQDPEIAKNPALQPTSAATSLHEKLQPVIAQWIVEQCGDALKRHRNEWEASTVSFVESQRTISEKLLLRLENSQRVHPSLPSTQPDVPLSMQAAPAHGQENTTITPTAISTSVVQPVETHNNNLRDPYRVERPTRRRGPEGAGQPATTTTTRRESTSTPTVHVMTQLTSNDMQGLRTAHRAQHGAQQRQGCPPASTNPSVAVHKEGEGIETQERLVATAVSGKKWRQKHGVKG